MARVDDDADRYDRELRPDLMKRALEQLRAAGIEPDIWKIEGLDRREECRRVAELVRADGRDNVVCVVLGRGADDNAVDHWLRQGAGVPGYVGFAIGRTIWWDALTGWLDGSVDRDEAAKRISENYRRFIDVYTSAS
jgi:myo-inositol catabolism protein IolC